MGGGRTHILRLLCWSSLPPSVGWYNCYSQHMIIEENISLKNLTTFRLGGRTRYFMRARTIEDIKKACTWAASFGLPLFILGEGSNVLVSDKGFSGLTLKIELKGITYSYEKNDVLIIVSSGEPWDAFVAFTVQKGWYGIENLSNIPGTVGATPVQNVGAYGVEVKDVIKWVDVFDIKSRTTIKLDSEKCRFFYRDSLFKHDEGKNLIVTKVCFMLSREGEVNMEYRDVRQYFKRHNVRSPTLRQAREAIISIREKKFPDINSVGTGGSFFKNPVVSKKHFKQLKRKYPLMPHFELGDDKIKLPLAWILEHVCCIRGVRQQHVGTFKRQPLVLVHYGGGTAEELKKFADNIQTDIKLKTNITVVSEVSLVGIF